MQPVCITHSTEQRHGQGQELAEERQEEHEAEAGQDEAGCQEVGHFRAEDGRIARVRYVLPRHKAANWVGPGRGRKSTRPDASGVVELSPCDFLDRLADLVPPPRKHRHRPPI